MYTKNYRVVILGLLAILTLWIGYIGITQYQTVNQLLNPQRITAKGTADNSLEIGNLKITKVRVQDLEQSSRQSYWHTYISVTNLDRQTPSPKLDNTLLGLTNREQNRAIYGLQGHPSFLVSQQDLSFWRSQFYLQLLFYYGGLVIIGILYMLYYEINYRKDNKLFIPAIKNVILSLSFLFSGGGILKWGLDFRLFNFLNDQFYLGEPSPPINTTMIYLGVALLFMGIIMQRVIKLQQEQDLTI